MAHKTAEMDRCIKECFDCASVCLETMAHCLAKGGEHAAAEHIMLLQDCAESCRRCEASCREMAGVAA